MPNRYRQRIRQKQKEADKSTSTSERHKDEDGKDDEQYEREMKTRVNLTTVKLGQTKEFKRFAENMYSGGSEEEKDMLESMRKMENIKATAKAKLDDEHMKFVDRGIELEDPFSEGDQSPVSGDEALVLQFQWGLGFNYHPLRVGWMSDWSRVCFTGDIEEIRLWIESEPTIIEYRESPRRMCGILQVIDGSRAASEPNFFPPEVKRKQDFKAALEFLIDKGANIQSRDFAGLSPLHHCISGGAGGVGDDTLPFEMAKILLKRGADPNAVDRLGRTPVFDAAQSFKVNFVELLLENGAKMNVKDNDGRWLINTVYTNPIWIPKLHRLFVKALAREGKEQKAEARARGSYRKCALCGKDKKCQRCSGCFVQWYCSADCQKEQWTDHKEDCKRTRKEYKKIKLDREMKNTTIHQQEKAVKSSKITKEHFLVKITIPLEDGVKPWCSESFRNHHKHPIKHGLLLYDRDRNIYGVIPKTDKHYSDIVEKVKTEGVAGAQGYFYAILKDGKINVNISQIQPPEDF